MNAYEHPSVDRLDAATHRRLRQLARVPIDTSRVESRLRSELGTVAPERNTWRLRQWPAWGGLAAALVLLASVIFTTLGTESVAMATPVRLAELHQSVMNDTESLRAATVDDLRRVLASGWDGQASLDRLPADLMGSCCLNSLDGKPVLGLVLRHGETPMSVLIVDAETVRVAEGQEVVRGNRRYVTHEMSGVGMAMVEVESRLVCFMGAAPVEVLVDIAEQSLGGAHGL